MCALLPMQLSAPHSVCLCACLAANVSSRNLYQLKPTMKAWVPHVASFIAPRQVLLLGDPTRRSTDASESLGAVQKKRIKYLTCRRRLRTVASEHVQDVSCGTGRARRWKASFTKGYIEQVFSRSCVSNMLRHGAENKPYLQRKDEKRAQFGKVNAPKLEGSNAARPDRLITKACEAYEPEAADL